MKQLFSYSLILFVAISSLTACSNRNNETDGNEEQKVNVSDSRRNTPGSVNTITGDSNKVATDSAQHGIRNRKRENM
jgi:predicted small lipoprotein YifL